MHAAVYKLFSMFQIAFQTEESKAEIAKADRRAQQAIGMEGDDQNVSPVK